MKLLLLAPLSYWEADAIVVNISSRKLQLIRENLIDVILIEQRQLSIEKKLYKSFDRIIMTQPMKFIE